jgi:hypothetical protein
MSTASNIFEDIFPLIPSFITSFKASDDSIKQIAFWDPSNFNCARLSAAPESVEQSGTFLFVS